MIILMAKYPIVFFPLEAVKNVFNELSDTANYLYLISLDPGPCLNR